MYEYIQNTSAFQRRGKSAQVKGIGKYAFDECARSDDSLGQK